MLENRDFHLVPWVMTLANPSHLTHGGGQRWYLVFGICVTAIACLLHPGEKDLASKVNTLCKKIITAFSITQKFLCLLSYACLWGFLLIDLILWQLVC